MHSSDQIKTHWTENVQLRGKKQESFSSPLLLQNIICYKEFFVSVIPQAPLYSILSL